MSAPIMLPPLGFIEKHLRTPAQNAAFLDALQYRVRFTLPFTTPPVGTKVDLTQTWKDPLVVADIGQPFTGFGQKTGSCVGVSDGDCVATLSFVQRKLTDGATKAFVPFWPFMYGRCRYNEGDRGQGEGAVDSVMGRTITTEGVISINDPAVASMNLPGFTWDANGLWISGGSSTEYRWSDGNYSGNLALLPIAKAHVVHGIATLSSPDDIAAAIINGYPVLDGCSMYCGSGSIKGSGADAYSGTRYTGRGGHSTCFLGYWVHPTDGELFLYSNQWDTSTYPVDPAGAGRCCAWMPKSEVAKLFTSYGGDGGETMALSHLDYFPAQPAVLDWYI